MSNRGAALLEVLIALSVLAVAGLAFVELSQAALAGVARVREIEERLLDQDRLLAAYTLLNRRDLDARPGTRRVGPYVVRVERLDLELFRLSIGLPAGGPDLTTFLYRPEPTGE